MVTSYFELSVEGPILESSDPCTTQQPLQQLQIEIALNMH